MHSGLPGSPLANPLPSTDAVSLRPCRSHTAAKQLTVRHRQVTFPVPYLLWVVFLIRIFALEVAADSRPTYSERYRPQFHFSAASGWVGDPDGLIRYHNTYHLFWWGHATSTDLVHWKQLDYPMQGGDGSFSYYSGSVVVDTADTAGFGTPGTPAMVAVYTGHKRSDSLENQRISYSTNYTTFHYYSGNPVLDINSTSFRDPDVFWDIQSHRWIMVVALPEDRKINFYASPDLKSWQYISQFGPVGAREQIWEVPNILQLPVGSDTNNLKWVLVCGMGPNKEQYFVGNFDGATFTMDSACRSYLVQGTGLEGAVFADFEAPTYSGWTAEGAAFGTGPAANPLPGPQKVSGYLGARLVNSFLGGNDATGKLTSATFTITNNCISFLLGGGNHPGQTCINLLVDGVPVRTSTGSNSDTMKWLGWDVTQWKGRAAQLQIVDTSTASRGYILIDHILFSDVLMNTGLEHANWIDWGSDFYAARAFRDYDHAGQSTTWIGWMGNWQYAREVPTSWGRGAESLPRTLHLRPSPAGYQVTQRPLPALQALRGPLVKADPREVRGTVSLTDFQPRANAYEIEASFDLHSSSQRLGLNLCVGGTNKVVVGYDASASNVFLDRRASGNISFSPMFPNIVAAPLPRPPQQSIQFHIFVDQSSIEIFVNDGQAVLTSLIFPDPANLGVQAFSAPGPTTLQTLRAWPLSSIWHQP